jgi:hypothetical protein
MMEPYEAVNSIEASLRVLIYEILGETWTNGSGIDIDALRGKRKVEEASRRGAIVDQNLLAYTELYQLQSIVQKNWAKFKPTFGDKGRFDAFFDRAEHFRNAIMHNRELLPFERDLLSGISGELRNLIAISRSSLDHDRKHYPVVESVVDSFGNELSFQDGINQLSVRLQVGSEVEFTCRAWDVSARELSWTLTIDNITISEAVGDRVVLTWPVTESNVGENTFLYIRMSSNGRYHRFKNWDSSIISRYAVEPPILDSDGVEERS